MMKQILFKKVECFLLKHWLNRVSVESKTWLRDSHGLYDYESSQLRTQFFEQEGSCK